jgi:hypothetical protein
MAKILCDRKQYTLYCGEELSSVNETDFLSN